ncbi:Collagen alpha-1(VII) chain [Ophiophagus hannah]|uniref:Collagen alpha-1(VII) chain n=1 Tax=Ophiophagus hannah TaxID=8665 RepID=V8NUD0_OPHHA|nr:Collagen alpha-1(VII) chain [Ophiophagus hannah]
MTGERGEQGSPGLDGLRGEKGVPGMTEEEVRQFVRQEMSQHCACGSQFSVSERRNLPNDPSTHPYPSVKAQIIPVLKLSHAEEEEGSQERNILKASRPEYEYIYTEDDYEEGLIADGTESPMLRDADLCTLRLEQGDCSKFTLQWYYNQRVLECRPFIYSGCGGNSNRFSSKEDCELYCKPQADTVNSTVDGNKTV